MMPDTNVKPLLADFLTVDQLACELGKTSATIYRWLRLRIAPPHVKVENKALFKREDVLLWLEANKSRPVSIQGKQR
jgi:predicted DNA-binding transcriptional regulator AlpA